MKIVLITLLALAGLLLVAYAWLGGFTKVNVSEEIQGGETLVFKEVRGDYKKSGKMMDEVYYDLLNNEKIETTMGFGIYYDNPKEVETAELRSDAGCILTEADVDKAENLKEKYQVKRFPEGKYVVAEFPFRSKMSVMMSIMKVYPALSKFCEEKGYQTDTPVMEIYDVPNKKILYRKEIKK